MIRPPAPVPSDADERPPFMVVLGVLPPYILDDVKQAYLEKVKTAHPDYGGAIAEFRRIQEAYEQAQEFVAIQTDRRSWIAGQMDRYIAQQEVEQQLRDMGATLDIQYAEWLQKSIGDFAELTAMIESIELVDSPNGNAVIDYMVGHQGSLLRLKRLVLAGCGVSIDQARKLANFQLLNELDLSRNRLNGSVSQLAADLPNLHTLRLDGASVGWWSRMQIGRTLRKRQSQLNPLHPLD